MPRTRTTWRSDEELLRVSDNITAASTITVVVLIHHFINHNITVNKYLSWNKITIRYDYCIKPFVPTANGRLGASVRLRLFRNLSKVSGSVSNHII